MCCGTWIEYLCPILSRCSVASSEASHSVLPSLIPRSSPPPSLQSLVQYASMDRESLGDLVTCGNIGRHMGGGAQQGILKPSLVMSIRGLEARAFLGQQQCCSLFTTPRTGWHETRIITVRHHPPCVYCRCIDVIYLRVAISLFLLLWVWSSEESLFVGRDPSLHFLQQISWSHTLWYIAATQYNGVDVTGYILFLGLLYTSSKGMPHPLKTTPTQIILRPVLNCCILSCMWML